MSQASQPSAGLISAGNFLNRAAFFHLHDTTAQTRLTESVVNYNVFGFNQAEADI